MKQVIILDCCGYEVKTGSKLYEYIECFKAKSGAYFKKRLSDNRQVKKEIMLLTVCPKCNHYVLTFLWYAKSNCRFQDWDESKIIRGKKADEIFARRQDNYKMISLPNPFKPKIDGKQSKKIPWTYYKNLDGYSQIPRYIDETEDAGLKINCKTKVEKI